MMTPCEIILLVFISVSLVCGVVAKLCEDNRAGEMTDTIAEIQKEAGRIRRWIETAHEDWKKDREAARARYSKRA